MGFEFSSESLPTSFNFKQASERIFNGWVEAGYFHGDPESEKPHFSIVIPPPNVTGALHLGHALNNTLQDILARMKRMQGYETLWMPGTDHAGIATQAVVERRLKEEETKPATILAERHWSKEFGSGKDSTKSEFFLNSNSLVLVVTGNALGLLWMRYVPAVRTTFFDLFKKKYIYRGKRLVNWDTFLQTAVSDDEVFHAVVEGHFWHFRYPVLDPQDGEPAYVVVATTRPETMLGDTAVAVHPDPERALHKVQQELESKLAEAADGEKQQLQQQLDELEQRRLEVLPGLLKLRDMALAGRKLVLPLMNREILLVADEWAKPEMGSGCVKITPAHDPNDYEVGQRCGLEKINILRPDGTLNANAGEYEGLTIKESASPCGGGFRSTWLDGSNRGSGNRSRSFRS